MALLFQRIARNFVKDGYFPTDAETTSRVLSALAPCIEGRMRLLDPCAGEGVAAAECRHHLGQERAEDYGIEIDAEWAYQTLGRRYVRYINHTYRRSGTLWEGRYHASLVQGDRYLLTCYQYIELNSVRANITGGSC